MDASPAGEPGIFSGSRKLMARRSSGLADNEVGRAAHVAGRVGGNIARVKFENGIRLPVAVVDKLKSGHHGQFFLTYPCHSRSDQPYARPESTRRKTFSENPVCPRLPARGADADGFDAPAFAGLSHGENPIGGIAAKPRFTKNRICAPPACTAAACRQNWCRKCAGPGQSRLFSKISGHRARRKIWSARLPKSNRM